MADSLPVSGRIDPKSFPFLLIDLHKNNATGSLKVEGAHHQKALYFRGGRVLFGSSNDPKDQLGAILIESGKITEQQLEDVNKNVGPGNPLAKALSDSGIVSQRELSDAARAKVERILSDVISYTTGSFEFEDGVLPKGAVDLKLSPERLVVAAVRRVGDRPFVLRHLESLDVLLRPTPALQTALPEIEAEVGGLVAHLDGATTLKEAAGRAATDEFDASKIACGLLFLGLLEKASGQVLPEADESASPFFQPSEDAVADLNLAQGSSPNLSFGSVNAEPTVTASAEELGVPMVEPPPPPPSGGDADATIVMGDLPNFSLPQLDSSGHMVSAPPPSIPSFTPPPAPPPALSGPSPLKIIPPPKASERTRPPTKPSKQDLAALDELLGKKSPEGPLTPISKPADEEWKPQFLPPRGRGGKAPSGKKSSLSRTAVLGGALGLILIGGAVAGWWYWSQQQAKPVRVAAKPPATTAPASSTTLAASPTNAPSAAPSPAASPAASAPPVSTTLPPKTTAPTPPPTTSAPAAKTTPAPKATPEPKPSAAAPKHPAAAGVAEARAMLRKGQFAEAAQAFQSHLKEGKATHSVQILLACSTDTIQKAMSHVQADDFFIVPIHYRGKDCYRLAWGIYDSEAKANTGARGVPEYFKEGGAKPKVVTVAEILR